MLCFFSLVALAADPPARIAHFVEQGEVCRWEAVTIGGGGPPATLVELPGRCAINSVRANREGSRALIERSTNTGAGAIQLTEVDLARGVAVPIGGPPVPYSSGIGYGADGAPRVFAIVDGTPVGGSPQQPTALVYEGRTYTVGETDGQPVIAVEYARRDGAWVLVDSALTETGFCGARDVLALTSFSDTVEVPAVPAWQDATPGEVQALVAASGRPADRFADGAWLLQRGAGVALAQWSDMIEGLSPSDVLLVQIGGAWRPLLAEPPASSGLTVDTRGSYTLVWAHDLKTPPRVYDLRDGRVVWTETTGTLTAWSPR